jgi:hypothetical protein
MHGCKPKGEIDRPEMRWESESLTFQSSVSLNDQAEDFRAPVIYLRSFQTDKDFSCRHRILRSLFSVQTEEEQLAEVLREIGPVIAIGRPGEVLPSLGANRTYIEDANWQDQVLAWFARAALVVVHIPPEPTEGIAWEIDRSLSDVAPERLVFLVPRNQIPQMCLDWLNRKLQHHGFDQIPVAMLTQAASPVYSSRLARIVYFTSDKRCEFSPLVRPPFFRRTLSSPLVRVYKLALKPVIMRATGSWTPPSLAFDEAIFAAFLILLCAVTIAMAVYNWQRSPFDREAIKLDIRIAKHPQLSAEIHQNRNREALQIRAQSLFQAGIRYIPDEDVLVQASINMRLLNLAKPADCAGLADGTIPQENLKRLLDELGRADPALLHAWFTFLEKVLIESLATKHEKVFAVSEADDSDAWSAFYEALHQEVADRFMRISDNYEASAAEDRCWLERTLFENLVVLDEPSLSKLARVALGQQVEE